MTCGIDWTFISRLDLGFGESVLKRCVLDAVELVDTVVIQALYLTHRGMGHRDRCHDWSTGILANGRRQKLAALASRVVSKTSLYQAHSISSPQLGSCRHNTPTPGNVGDASPTWDFPVLHPPRSVDTDSNLFDAVCLLRTGPGPIRAE
jgi:hypothetical protein